MNAEICAAAIERGISRLCHLTPLRNLVHIATGDGLLSTEQLADSDRRDFNRQDLERFDNRPDHICCSIEYPNGWYLRQRRRDLSRDTALFPDWVCLALDPKHLWADKTLLCPRNAAAQGGRLIGGGIETFTSLYNPVVEGAGGRTFKRSRLPSACPTDDQAEVLVYRNVPLQDVQHLIVVDESQAKRIVVALSQMGLQENLFNIRICPELFNPVRLSSQLRSGTRPTEVDWDHRETAGE